MSFTRRTLFCLALALVSACSCSSGPELPETRSLPADTPGEPLAPLWIDTRLPAPFAEGHVPGALNLQWDWEQLAERIEAYVPDHSRPIYLRASDPDEQRAALELLRGRGYSDVTAPTPPPETETLPVMKTDELATHLEAGEDFVLIDVRSGLEHFSETIDGALLVDPDAAASMLEDLDPRKRYYIICEGGYRSGQLASWMHLHGFEDVHNVIDGMAGWRKR